MRLKYNNYIGGGLSRYRPKGMLDSGHGEAYTNMNMRDPHEWPQTSLTQGLLGSRFLTQHLEGIL